MRSSWLLLLLLRLLLHLLPQQAKHSTVRALPSLPPSRAKSGNPNRLPLLVPRPRPLGQIFFRTRPRPLHRPLELDKSSLVPSNALVERPVEMHKFSCASSRRPLELDNSSFVPFEVLTKAFRIGQLLFHIV